MCPRGSESNETDMAENVSDRYKDQVFPVEIPPIITITPPVGEEGNL